MGLWGAADSRGRPLVSEGRFGIRYPWRSSSSCFGGCRCSTMEILMRGVCIICAYTGVNYTLPTSRRVCYSRGCYDIQYSFDLRGGVACQPGVICITIQHIILRSRSRPIRPKAPRTARGCRATARAVALSPILISYSTLYSILVL